jgi:dipeptidyl aminopeptidase/acylaminoacyl peptidase
MVSPGAAPTLIVHGDADNVVPMLEGETIYAALPKAGVPASFVRIEGAGHGSRGPLSHVPPPKWCGGSSYVSATQ